VHAGLEKGGWLAIQRPYHGVGKQKTVSCSWAGEEGGSRVDEKGELDVH